MAGPIKIDADHGTLTVTNEPMPKQQTTKKSPRKRMLVIFGSVITVVALGWAAYAYLIGSNFVSTDNAYVAAYSATLTPQTSGAVSEVRVRDGQAVHSGDVLVVLDDADARLALASVTARAAFGDADIVRNGALVTSARNTLERTRSEYQRRQKIERSGAVSAEDLATAKAGNDAAEAALRAATAALDQAQAAKLEAQAAVSIAQLNLDRTIIRAPIDGIVARRRVQVGERVALGSELLTIVPIDQAYVEANFKETQLRKIRVGQRVTLTADRYGSSVEYQGRVEGIGGGTGSAFAIIPAQNATGNWIKVVQRLPVHITLKAEELREHPLRVGLSMEATVDVSAPQSQHVAGAKG
jgi:membrane fusion protein, multidrug efflux system